jgi:hypothetical protein
MRHNLKQAGEIAEEMGLARHPRTPQAQHHFTGNVEVCPAGDSKKTAAYALGYAEAHLKKLPVEVEEPQFES